MQNFSRIEGVPVLAGADSGVYAGTGAHPWNGEAPFKIPTPFDSIQVPVHHWAPSPGRSPVSALVGGLGDLSRNGPINKINCS